ncbi:Zinc finger C-x8-C-x5-C-x3-H type (and similar) family protein [Candida parapsilosis]|uniref:C3H1-type domain-containing protein n=2 Tax=Candida parapsilosis TaxID=5480 RepID=G8BAQ5_CANPC|nr:uncharacterized protein CPAR2_806780 [Candida parapsilosis]KAF6052025.1 Zinc finger C-x8-C-x5-C-x3-H type (and similar) family protein [Candida parapsilosis]KAF6052478.1 Zinc finger C-x8-C-x5-C-x3-H type (and similar) family protein [Candida parapsilosis]KAF6053827.1 Zinc finger C-x8-C-x5-C-x3-H type (and similar) family protein [Candida parapsilosis]KAF6064254.1 Zinc finger C-x8-C-x5-C-x3-H type (and similar) family protein [Candida parapsilosis]KAI5902269.1 Zinc finger protein LEE1 [Candi
MPQSKAASFRSDNHCHINNNNFKFHKHPNATTDGFNDKQQPRQPLGHAFDLSSLGADLPPNTGPPGTVPVTNGSSSNANKNLSHVPCKFFKQGNCQAGDSCPFSHNIEGALAADKLPCKYFLRGNCKFGLKCALAHYLPDGTRVNGRNIMDHNWNNGGDGYPKHNYGAKQQKFNNGHGSHYPTNQGHGKTSPEYDYRRLGGLEGDTVTRERYSSVSPPDTNLAEINAFQNPGYYNSYKGKQQGHPHQPVFSYFGQQQQQTYTQPRNISQKEAPISFDSLTDDSLSRFCNQPQQGIPTTSQNEPLSWSPVEQYAKPVDYHAQWGVQHRRVGSHNHPHSLGSDTFSNVFTEANAFNVPAPQSQSGVRRSYSTGGQFPTVKTTISPPKISTTSGINIQSSTPSATTPTSRFSLNSAESTAISQTNDCNLPVKPNISQYSYQHMSLTSPVFDDEEDEGVEDEQLATSDEHNYSRNHNGSLDIGHRQHQLFTDDVFEGDFLPGLLADVILTPQELKRRDSRSQSGTLNSRPSLRGLLEGIECSEINERSDFDGKPRGTPHEDVFLME